MRNDEQPPQGSRPFPRYRPLRAAHQNKVGPRFESTVPDGRLLAQRRARRRARAGHAYQVAVTPKGAQLSYGFKRRRATSEAQLDPFGVDWFLQPVSDGGDAATVASEAASRVKKVEAEAGGFFVASGDALYGYSNRTTNATLERRSALGATADYGGVGVVLCKGSPLVAVEVDKGRSVVLAPGGAGGGGAAASRVSR